MTAPIYTAMGGMVFVQERHPVTMERAEAIRAVHLHNVSHWLEQAHLSQFARLSMAKIEQGLADEMAEAIASVFSVSTPTNMKDAA